jgi:transcriptional regulator with XRE-family HTH domain/gamma-glutamylcyclotransferase (GGCT)/AIG2-like uncharacterized protein YtfP
LEIGHRKWRISMNSIQIGKIISIKRKEKGITQEELASFLGVSKPAVSKWESGQSYPDIMLLPELASYFNISVDQLIGYEPQMTKEEVRKLYHRLADKFAKEPFDKVYGECEEYIKKYFSSWYLQHQLALLFVNHANLAGDLDRAKGIMEKALEMFIRVEKSSDDVALARLSLQMESVCYLALTRPVEAIDILENLNEQIMSTESLLVKAYQMKGDQKKAMEHLQGHTILNLLTMLGAAPDYFQMYAGQPERMTKYYKLYVKLGELFEVEQMYPAALIQIHLVAAMVYVSQGDKNSAMDALEQYMLLVNRSKQRDFLLQGNDYFDELEGYYSSLDIESEAPRSSKVIWNDIKNALLSNPAFAVLEPEERFQQIKRRLEIV